MMVRRFHFRVAACLAILLVSGGASLPRAIQGPGEWEIGKTADARGERVCLPDPAVLMRWEHRGRSCRQTIMNSSLDRAEVQYTCTTGGFGSSSVKVLTPRSVRVSTQGINDGGPFNYTVHARRLGNCRPK